MKVSPALNLADAQERIFYSVEEDGTVRWPWRASGLRAGMWVLQGPAVGIPRVGKT